MGNRQAANARPAAALPCTGRSLLSTTPEQSAATICVAIQGHGQADAGGLAALLQGIWRRAKGRPLFKAGSLDAWLRRKGGPVSVFYVFCALALAGALAALRTAQL